jgi:hypothetical protein
MDVDTLQTRVLSGQSSAGESVSGIWSRWKGRRYKVLHLTGNIRKDRDTRNPAKTMLDFQTNFSCELKDRRMILKAYFNGLS